MAITKSRFPGISARAALERKRGQAWRGQEMVSIFSFSSLSRRPDHDDNQADRA
jgi:hypothetical protein